MSAWKEGVDVIYNHVKQGGNACMQFAFEYNDDERNKYIGRISKLYYYVLLYEEKKPVGAIIEGQIDNVDPRKKNK